MCIFIFIYLLREECVHWKAHAPLVVMASVVVILKICTFSYQGVLKEGDALLSLLFNIDSGYAIGNVQ